MYITGSRYFTLLIYTSLCDSTLAYITLYQFAFNLYESVLAVSVSMILYLFLDWSTLAIWSLSLHESVLVCICIH